MITFFHATLVAGGLIALIGTIVAFALLLSILRDTRALAQERRAFDAELQRLVSDPSLRGIVVVEGSETGRFSGSGSIGGSASALS